MHDNRRKPTLRSWFPPASVGYGDLNSDHQACVLSTEFFLPGPGSPLPPGLAWLGIYYVLGASLEILAVLSVGMAGIYHHTWEDIALNKHE